MSMSIKSDNEIGNPILPLNEFFVAAMASDDVLATLLCTVGSAGIFFGLLGGVYRTSSRIADTIDLIAIGLSIDVGSPSLADCTRSDTRTLVFTTWKYFGYSISVAPF